MYTPTDNSSLTSFGYRHPYAVTGVRIAAAIWTLIIGVILVSHGYRGAGALFAVSAAVFAVAYIRARAFFGYRRDGRS
jgi:hypothetical protein